MREREGRPHCFFTDPTPTPATAAPECYSDEAKEMPVFTAVKECGDDPEKIRNHFEMDNVSVDVEDAAGMTPLMHACWKNYPRVVKFLIGLVRTF